MKRCIQRLIAGLLALNIFMFVGCGGGGGGGAESNNDGPSGSEPVINTYPTGAQGATGLAVDASGNVWVTNYDSNNVKKFSPSGAVVGTYNAGSNPDDIVIDSSGNVWIANLNGVTKLGSAGNYIGFYALNSVDKLAIDSAGRVWAVGGNVVTIFSSAGVFVDDFLVNNYITGIAIDGSDNVWLISSFNNVLIKLSPNGSLLGSYSTNSPEAIAIDSTGNVWVCNYSSSVSKFSSSGTQLGNFTVYGSPYAIAVDGEDHVWVASKGQALKAPTNISPGADLNSIAYEKYNNITELSNSGDVMNTYPQDATVITVSNLNALNLFWWPSGIAIDESGNVWVTDLDQNILSKIVGVAESVTTPL